VTADRPSYVIDGQNFTTLDGFYEEVGRVLIPGQQWGRNLDAFNDILSWPSLDAGELYLLTWKNADLSKQRLGHAAMANKLERTLRTCHQSNVSSITERLQAAREEKGPTLFDWLVEIIRENKEYVNLRLE
jgi:RNAse (barnase) inhibitor barstar